MSKDYPTPMPRDLEGIAKQLGNAEAGSATAFDVKGSEGHSEQLVDAIEMIGEEQAAQLPPPRDDGISPGMRYLHSSRTIHQLVTDRNRAVGLFLAVASLLLTASSAIMNADPNVARDLIIPLAKVQRWCLPITFGALTIMALFVAFLLIRTRVGLIYEVAKMNALLGLPIGRVSRIQPLSIFFIMQSIISLAGGACAGLLAVHLLLLADPQRDGVGLYATLIGAGVAAALLLLYVVTVLHTTSDRRLQSVGK